MKLYNKIIGLLLISMLSIGVVGCTRNEIENTTQQEKLKDVVEQAREDLEYYDMVFYNIKDISNITTMTKEDLETMKQSFKNEEKNLRDYNEIYKTATLKQSLIDVIHSIITELDTYIKGLKSNNNSIVELGLPMTDIYIDIYNNQYQKVLNSITVEEELSQKMKYEIQMAKNDFEFYNDINNRFDLLDADLQIAYRKEDRSAASKKLLELEELIEKVESYKDKKLDNDFSFDVWVSQKAYIKYRYNRIVIFANGGDIGEYGQNYTIRNLYQNSLIRLNLAINNNDLSEEYYNSFFN